jgi:murein L,D-transpeptidase YafK
VTALAILQTRATGRLCRFLLCIMLSALLLSGCSGLDEGLPATATFEEANALFRQENFRAALATYEQVIAKNPPDADRVLFEMGILYSHPKNAEQDYQKALACFQKLIQDYPGSQYRQNSQMMLFSINNVAMKDKTIATQQTLIATLRNEREEKELEMEAQFKRIAALEQMVMATAIRKGAIDKILIEKNARRLLLMDNGAVLKTYRIALGGNPVGPKERQGDNKTPEGTYVIDARNKESRYHRSLRISYPNERDKKRAQELGVDPGGDIMIHGIKNGFSWVGDGHAEFDWTQGCIAVTNDEIEEIAKVAPNGTIVEIRP